MGADRSCYVSPFATSIVLVNFEKNIFCFSLDAVSSTIWQNGSPSLNRMIMYLIFVFFEF